MTWDDLRHDCTPPTRAERFVHWWIKSAPWLLACWLCFDAGLIAGIMIMAISLR